MELSVDCLIIGGGPAGLTAATYLGRFRRNILLVDNGESRASWIPVSHNILGFSKGVTGPQLLQSLRQQSDRYGAQRIAGTVETLEREGDGYFATTGGDRITASKVLIATGGLDVQPRIKDVKSLVEAGLIRHCPICDAYEARGKRIALVAYGKCRVKEALLIRGFTSDLTVLTLGHATEIAPKDMADLQQAGIKVVTCPIVKLSRGSGLIEAWPENGEAPLRFETIYSALGMKLRSDLATSLGASVDEDGALLVDRHQQTSVEGMYAAGDIVHGLSQVSVAAGQAAIAATAINASLPPIQY